jgi:PKD repeat protein
LGIAPLAVQFTVTAPQGTTVGNSVNFGDGTSGNLGFAPVCSNCNLLAVVSHTYTATGTYTATLTSGNCACPANGICNCPNMMIVATTTVTVTATGSPSSTTSGIQQLNAPGSVALAIGGIAEIRNASFYFTLTSVTASNATINITPVGCWNSFPSDPIPAIRCMIAVVPTPPQTLSVGQKYVFGNYGITLTNIASGTATFSVEY